MPGAATGGRSTATSLLRRISMFIEGTILTAARALKPEKMSAKEATARMSEIQEPPERGRLAQVIATRGGLAPPEAPFVIEHREALIYLLCQAAELEHGIMCQYLYAAFTLKQSQDEGLTAAEVEAVQRWRRKISHVATQEMLHLSLVQNLLSAIGGRPAHVPAELPAPGQPLPGGRAPGADAVRRPGPAPLHVPGAPRGHGPQGRRRDGRLRPGPARAVPPGEIVPHGQDFKTVGHLYRSIEAGIAHLADKYGERRLFVGPPRAQATQQYFGWPELIPVTDAASAQRAIDEILEQGEGPRGNWQDAHFGQFVAILDEFEQLRAANRAFDPVRPAVVVNVRPAERDVEVPLVTDPLTRQVMDLFNVSYEILLTMLQRFFAHTEETDVQLKALADATVALMFGVIKPLGDLVTTLPAGPEYPGRTAGPSFELFYESDYVLPHREAAWILLTERIGVAAEFCEPGVPCDPAVADRLAAVRSGLTEIAQALAAHLPARDARLPAENQPPAEDLGTLLARAEDFYRTGAAFTRHDDELLSGLGALLRSTYQVIRSQPADVRLVARLVNSVLRPLTEAGLAKTEKIPTPETPEPETPEPYYPEPSRPPRPCWTWPQPRPRSAPASVPSPRLAC